MNSDISTYNQGTSKPELCTKLAEIIDQNLPATESKIWHAHPVWFIDGNPIVG